MEEVSITIEETNILRAKIGLPPIPVPSSETPGSRSRNELTVEETNKVRQSLGLKPIEVIEKQPKKVQSEKERQEKEQKIKERLSDAKVRTELKKKAQFGRTLLDSYDEQSTDDWLTSLGSKTKMPIEKQKERSTQKRQSAPKKEEAEEDSVIISHNAEDLKNVEDNTIFTLEDNDILDENDELSNDNLTSKARVEKDLKEKKKLKEIGNGVGYKTLEQEDELDGSVVLKGGTIELAGVQDKIPVTDHSGDKRKIDIDLFEEHEPKKIKMKKIKKKKDDKKQRLKLIEDDDIKVESVALSAIENEVEDDLDEFLALQRKIKQQKRVTMKPEDIAKEIRKHAVADQENEMEKRVMKGRDMVFDPTSDFLSTLSVERKESEEGREGQEKEGLEENGVGEKPGIKPSIEDSKESKEFKKESEPKQVQSEKASEVSGSDVDSSDSLVDSVDSVVNFSLSSTLKHLKSIPSSTNKEQREHMKQLELTKIKISIEERKLKQLLQTNPEYTNMSPEDQESTLKEKLDEILIEKGIVTAKSDLGIPKQYNPQVSIQHRGDSGEKLDTKEAYKLLSSKFHGTKRNKKNTNVSKNKTTQKHKNTTQNTPRP